MAKKKQMTPGQKATRTRKLRTAGKKAARSRKLRTTGKKAATPRKRRAAGRKAAATRKRSSLHVGLDKLESRIASGRLGRAKPWAGADIIISTARPPSIDPIDATGGLYPHKDYVVTPFVAQLSWLFESLHDVFGKAIDLANKDTFYGRLAAAADRYGAKKSPEAQTAKELLGAVLKEAKQMVGEFTQPRE